MFERYETERTSPRHHHEEPSHAIETEEDTLTYEQGSAIVSVLSRIGEYDVLRLTRNDTEAADFRSGISKVLTSLRTCGYYPDSLTPR